MRKSPKYKTNKIRALGMFFCGLILIAIMTYVFIDQSLFLKKAIRGQGTIVSAFYSHVRYGRGWVLRVAYKPINSQEVEAILQGDNEPYHVGQTVYFLYDPDNYEKIRSLVWANQYPWVGILNISIYVVIAISGLIWFYITKRKESLASGKTSPFGAVE